MSPSATIDVVIPSFNGGELVTACVARLLQDPVVSQVIVVDDVSTDGTPERLSAAFAQVTVVVLRRHRGLAYAMNRGAERGTAEHVLFLNNDILAGDGAVARLTRALADDPAAASAGGRLVDPGTTRTQASYAPREIPDLAGLLVRLTGIEWRWPRNPWTGRHLTDPLSEQTRCRTDRQPAGACLLVRRTALEAVGGWDERYSMWYEDVDISRRLLRIGPAVYEPGAVFEHVGGASTSSWRKPDQHRRLHHSTLVYGQAFLPSIQQQVLAMAMIAVCLPRLLIALARHDATAAIYRRLIAAALAMLRLRPVPIPDHDAQRPR
jgi:N-acetylglucosaminyl-diphospho-decaprenol L-rhamnosyltransferase